MTRPATFDGLTIRAALFLGFGLVGGIWLFAGYYFTTRMADLERRSTDINARYMRAQDLLATARNRVLMGSVYVRDALLDASPTSVTTYRLQLEESYRAADQALQEYVPVVDVPGEQERIARLRQEIAEFRRTLVEVLATDSRLWPTYARTLLRERIMPKREGIMRVSEEVQVLNRSAFIQQQNEIAGVYRVTQRHVWQSFGLAVVVSLCIALGAIVYVGSLENRIRQQQLKDAENARDLQRLSSQILTAQEEERRTIARELHDEVGQVLMAIKVELSIAQRTVEAAGGPPNVLEDARSITDGALHAVRDLSHLLHPALLDDLGLAAAAEWYLKGFGKRHGIRTELLHEGMEERMLPEIEANAYRIVQEALTNVARHAHASTCRVYMQRLPQTLLVTIEDDGVGFDTAMADSEERTLGLGLIGIRERASNLRGTVRLESAPHKGTRVTVELPAHSRETPAEPAASEALSPVTATEVPSG